MAVAQETSNESEIVQDVLDFVSSLPIICDLKYGIAANPSCPPEALTKLAMEGDSWVARAAAMNPSCPIAEVMRLVLDKVYSRYR